jgi:hypothetical protein
MEGVLLAGRDCNVIKRNVLASEEMLFKGR